MHIINPDEYRHIDNGNGNRIICKDCGSYRYVKLRLPSSENRFWREDYEK